MEEKTTLPNILTNGLMKSNCLGIGSRKIGVNKRLAINNPMTSSTARVKMTSIGVLLILFSKRQYVVLATKPEASPIIEVKPTINQRKVSKLETYSRTTNIW